MNPLESFTIPVKGLKNDIHEYDFILDADFFTAFNSENTVKADISANVRFDKRPSMYILHIDLDGTIQADCDRCLEVIPVPVGEEHTLYIKRGEGEEEADVIYLENFDDTINIAKYIHDYALISLPLMNVRNCDEDESPLCNFEILDKWDSENKIVEEQTSSSIWDELNNLNLDNKK